LKNIVCYFVLFSCGHCIICLVAIVLSVLWPLYYLSVELRLLISTLWDLQMFLKDFDFLTCLCKSIWWYPRD